MEIGLARHVSDRSKKTMLDVPTDVAHLLTVIEEWYWTLEATRENPYSDLTTVGPERIRCFSEGWKYKVEAGQHTLGFDIIGEITGKYVTGYSYNLHRRLFHIDAIELKPQHTRLWLITPWGFDDLANDLAAYIRQAHSLDTPQTVATQPTETGTDEGQQGRPDRPPITDPIDQAIWAIVSDDPDLKDDQVAARLAEDYDIRNDEGLPLSRQAINPRRRTLEKMGYKVR